MDIEDKTVEDDGTLSMNQIVDDECQKILKFINDERKNYNKFPESDPYIEVTKFSSVRKNKLTVKIDISENQSSIQLRNNIRKQIQNNY